MILCCNLHKSTDCDFLNIVIMTNPESIGLQTLLPCSWKFDRKKLEE